MIRNQSPIRFFLISLAVAILPVVAQAQISGFLESQSFSAGEINNAKPPSGCSSNNTGQIMIVTSLALSGNDSPVSLAAANNKNWTKRGGIFSVEKSVGDEIKKSAGEVDVQSGALFENVPAGDKMTLYLSYDKCADLGKPKVLTREIESTPLEKCATKYFFVDLAKENICDDFQSEFTVCVHSKNQSGDYGPKRSFVYGKQDQEIKDFQAQNKDSIVSLGPCQNDTPTASQSGESAGQENSSQAIQSGSVGTGGGSGSNTAATLQVGAVGLGEQWVNDSLRELNKMRAEKNLSPLVLDPDLTELAKIRIRYLQSNNLLLEYPPDNIHQGFRENLAQIRKTKLNVSSQTAELYGSFSKETDISYGINSVKNSSEHYNAIIHPAHSRVGIAFATAEGMAHFIILIF